MVFAQIRVEHMTVRYVSVLLLFAAVVLTPSGARADPENYPRACVDASAVVEAARGYSQNTAAYKWDPKKLETAYNEYQACISAGADSSDLGYAVTGMIYVDLLQSAFYRDGALSAAIVLPHESPAQRRQFFENEKGRALSNLADAKRLIDKANGPRSGLNSDTMATVDKQYEDYKKAHTRIASLSYADSVRFVAQMTRPATTTAKARSSASPVPAGTTASLASAAATCDTPNADAQIATASRADLPPIAAQQGISGDVVVQVSVDETGHMTSATVQKSPSTLLNNAALTAARGSTFKAATADCLPVAGTVRMTVTF
jgi:TonB family protein